MRKLLTLSVVSASSVLLMACLPGNKPASSGPEASPAPATGGVTGKMGEIAKNILAGQAYSCTFTAKDNGQKMEFSMKGKKVKMAFADPSNPNKSMNMIGDNEVSYIWDPATKQGMKMTIPKETPTPQAQLGKPEIPDLNDLQEWEKAQEKYDVNCTPAMLKDSDFVPPTDVTFQDLSELMKQVPAGMMKQGATPGVPNQAQYQMQIPAEPVEE